MPSEIESAFREVCDGFSIDRVVADPQLNLKFVDACRANGLVAPATELNQQLINMRKAGKLGRLNSKPTRFDDSEYRFAVEIVVRHLERRDQVTLDDILVSPTRANELDMLCRDFVPSFSSLEYRWSALGLRKARKLKPEIVGHAIPSTEVKLFNTAGLTLGSIPKSSGIYCFFTPTQTLYVGEAGDLRSRIKKHLNHSDNKLLARWIWGEGVEELFIEVHCLSPEVTTRQRRAVELEMIRSRNPVFNVLGK